MIKTTGRNVWILGATGYIGSALLRHLSADSKNRIHLLVHKRLPFRYLEPFNTFTGSIADFDPAWFERYPPDVIFHLARPAGSTFLTRYFKSRQGESANRRLVNILSRLPNPPVVVYVSGSLMYGRRTADDPADEDSPLQPDSFGRHYIRNETPWIEAQQKDILDVRFARPGWIIGPGSWFARFFWKPCLETGKVPCYGDGNHPMSLIHVEDGAAMIDALARHGKRGQNLNLFTGKIVMHRTFCETLARVLNTTVETIPLPVMQKRFGKTTAYALVSSTPMTTRYPELHSMAKTRFGDAESILRHVTGLLKNV